MTNELEPCPFCGGEAEIERQGNNRQSMIYACTDCGCRLETGETGHNYRQWNTRAQPSQGVLEWRGNDLFYNGRCIGYVRWYSALSGRWSYKLAAEESVIVASEPKARAALEAAAREWLFPASKEG
jgi:Lar family restriction alleviation protein